MKYTTISVFLIYIYSLSQYIGINSYECFPYCPLPTVLAAQTPTVKLPARTADGNSPPPFF